MHIWEITFDTDRFQNLTFVHPGFDFQQTTWMRWFAGRPLAQEWQAITVARETTDQRLRGDFPSLPGAFICNQRALDTLYPLIVGHVEVLPLICDTENLYVINIIQVLDCLNHELSQFKRFSSGRIMRVEKYVFKEGCIGTVPLFKIPEQIDNRIYASDMFKQAVEQHGLQGIVFTEIGVV